MNKVSRFNGSCVDEVNYKAQHGVLCKEDLQEWADTHNPNLKFIQWEVVEEEKTKYGIVFKVPRLTFREIDSD